MWEENTRVYLARLEQVKTKIQADGKLFNDVYEALQEPIISVGIWKLEQQEVPQRIDPSRNLVQTVEDLCFSEFVQEHAWGPLSGVLKTYAWYWHSVAYEFRKDRLAEQGRVWTPDTYFEIELGEAEQEIIGDAVDARFWPILHSINAYKLRELEEELLPKIDAELTGKGYATLAVPDEEEVVTQIEAAHRLYTGLDIPRERTVAVPPIRQILAPLAVTYGPRIIDRLVAGKAPVHLTFKAPKGRILKVQFG